MGQGVNPKGGARAPLPVWDPLVRITHWAVAMAVLVNGLLNKAGGNAHIWIGWALMAVLALRFAWGFLGPQEARFAQFPPNPRAAIAHIKALGRRRAGGAPLREYPSHNPAGALMIYALWGLLTVTALTGLVMTGGASPVRIAQEKAAVAAGDWSVLVQEGDEGQDEGSEFAEEVHEMAANLVLILALIHVAGVAVESRALGRNLVRPMLRKPQDPRNR